MKHMDRERWGMLVKELQGGTEFATLSEDQLMKAVDEEEVSLNLDSLGDNKHSATSNFYVGRAKLAAQDMQGAEQYLASALQPDSKGSVNLKKRQIYEARVGLVNARLSQHKQVSYFIAGLEQQITEMEPSSKLKYDDSYYQALWALAECYAAEGNDKQAIRVTQKEIQYAMKMSNNARLVLNSISSLGRTFGGHYRREAVSAMRKESLTLQSSGLMAGLANNDPVVVSFKYNLARWDLELAKEEGKEEDRNQGIALLKELEKLDLPSDGINPDERRMMAETYEDVRAILKKELKRR